MAHRLSPQAQADVDNLAYYLFIETGSIATADRIIESLTTRFSLLGSHPRAGRRRDDRRPGLRGFPVGEYVILYRVERDDAVILRVIGGRMDLESILRDEL